MERKFNINLADQAILQQALNLTGLDAVEASSLIESILDWRDPDLNARPSGAEDAYYLGLNPPGYAKNGPIDDLSELLWIRGMTPEIYFGPGAAPSNGAISPAVKARRPQRPTHSQEPVAQVGLVDLFTPISGRQININTASAAVLQLIPSIDPISAQHILTMRAGPDGAEGNEDDMPLRNVGELVNVPGIGPALAGVMARYFTVRSGTFEVRVTARIGKYQREYVSLLRRNNPRDIQILYFYWL